jgi:Skp family chaperone for outer membrane proteins
MKRMTRFSLVALSVVTTAALVAEGAKATTTTTPASSTTNTSASKVSATQSCQICVVDANQIMSQTKEAKEQNDKLTKRQKQLTADVQKIAQELKSKMDELETKKSTLSQKALENLQNEILALRGKYESTVQTSENTLKLDVQRATEALSAEAEKAGKQLAQAGNFDVVLDAASGRPIYISEKVKNNTQELVKIMDKNYETKSKTAKA